MAGLKKDNLSDSLLEYLEGLGLSEEQVQQLIDNISGDLSDLQTTDKSSLVAAINELFQNANNGKQLIATAIGEPLTAEDTFNAMSNDINGLLSTFKTNMMNNGVSVAGSDKFKQLIDKIATLADNEGSGIHYAEGTYRDFTEYLTTSGTSVPVSCDLNFTPTLIFVMFDSISNTAGTTISNVIISNKAVGRFYMNYTLSTMISNMTSNGFSMVFTYGNNSNITFNGVTWYAIGVGKEDTTLRDSLASILEEEGVSVTPEDDMASLIAKVDSEFDRQVVPAGDAVASNVLTGKTFINSSGQIQTGTMANRGGAQTVTPGTSNKTLNSGYYSGNITVKGDSNLVAANIVSGKSIFGVNGTATAIKVTAGSRFTFFSNSTRKTAPSNGIYSGSTTHCYTLEFDGTYDVSGSTYTSFNSVTLYVKIVLADSSGNIIQEFGENSYKLGSSNGGIVNTSATVTGKAGQIIILYGKCHYSNDTTKPGSLSFNRLVVTGEITKA